MAARSTLTVTSGTTITSAWGNSVRDHAVPRTTSNDATADGMVALNTSTERFIYHNGTTTIPIAGAMPRCRLLIEPTIIGTATATTGVIYTVPFWTETGGTDTDAFFNAGTSGSQVYAPFTGTYLVSFQVSFTSGSATGVREAYVYANGATRYADLVTPPTSTGAARLATATEIPLTAGDYIQILMYQDGGSNALIGTTADYLTMRYLGPT